MKKKNKHPQNSAPAMQWQTGEYERHQKLHVTFPYPFLLLCKLTNVTPWDVLHDFMDNLSCGSWKREGRDAIKEKLIEYFIGHGYGHAYYTPDQLRQIFREMDGVGMLFPQDADEELLNLYAKWRNKYQAFWFDKWFNKNRRQT